MLSILNTKFQGFVREKFLRSRHFSAQGAKRISTTGFSMIEMVVTMGIFIFVIGFSFGMGLDTYGRGDLNTERDMLVSLLYKARSRAINNINESAHGLYIDSPNDKYVVFQGSAYSSGDPLNEEFPFDGSVKLEGLNEVVFLPLSGQVPNPGDMHIKNDAKTYFIEVNGEGGIDW